MESLKKAVPEPMGHQAALHIIAWHVLTFLAAAAIVISRRPDAIFKPQFWAEDGAVFYRQAYELGLHSLGVPSAGYLNTLTRISALAALLFPFTVAPLVMNLFALAVQILPVNLFLSNRFSSTPIGTRLLGASFYLALPNAAEINVSSTNIPWHLALLACLVLFGAAPKSWGWRVFDVLTLVLISIDGPLGILLVPVAAGLWWKRRDSWARTSCMVLIPGALTQVATIMAAKSQRLIFSNGANLTRFIHIISRQVFLSCLLGVHNAHIFLQFPFAIEVLVTITGLSAIIYAVWHGPVELKLFILFVTAGFAASLAYPLASPSGPQWEALGIPGVGGRYYFLPMIAFLSALLWIATDSPVSRSLAMKIAALAVLLLLPVGIYSDWRYPQFVNFHFRTYAHEFEDAAPGTHLTIPINPPGWSMELSKH